jgi:hypothetical protein
MTGSPRTPPRPDKAMGGGQGATGQTKLWEEVKGLREKERLWEEVRELTGEPVEALGKHGEALGGG